MYHFYPQPRGGLFFFFTWVCGVYVCIHIHLCIHLYAHACRSAKVMSSVYFIHSRLHVLRKRLAEPRGCQCWHISPVNFLAVALLRSWNAGIPSALPAFTCPPSHALPAFTCVLEIQTQVLLMFHVIHSTTRPPPAPHQR